MKKPLVRLIKLNDLQYNANRDPQAYRRCVNEPFRIQALLEGRGEARCRLADDKGQVIVEKTVALPGTFGYEIAWPTPGVRLVTLSAEHGGETFSRDLRLDVMDHAWIG